MHANPGLRPISANLFGMFSSNSHKTVILSGAPHKLSRDTVLVARSRRTPKVLILPMPLVAFQPLKPALAPATAFPWKKNKCEPPEESCVLVLGSGG